MKKKKGKQRITKRSNVGEEKERNERKDFNNTFQNIETMGKSRKYKIKPLEKAKENAAKGNESEAMKVRQ